MTLLILAGCLLAATLFVLGVADLAAVSAVRRNLVVSVVDEDAAMTSRLDRWDRVFAKTRTGRWMQQQLLLADIDRPPLLVLLATLGATVVATYLLWKALAPAFGIGGLVAGFLGVRSYLERGRTRRREAFIAQMPQLARVLANSANANLSITTAVVNAGRELDDPAGEEMRRVSDNLQFGAGIEDALNEVKDRLPSREVALLVSTLIVCARSGGSLVTSLRDIAVTLDDRKEVRREVRTTLAQALFTGYLIVAMGFGLLFLLNALRAGTVEKMTTTPLGQAALVIALGLFAGGLLLIRKMTRIDP